MKSVETREKISRSVKRAMSNSNVRRKLSESHVGKRRSDSTKAKIRQGNLGQKRSPQTRLNISLSKRGMYHPNWKGGITLISDILRNTSRSREWSEQVKERDNYICINCEKDLKENLLNCHSHHIKSWAEFPELRHDLDNGITLCSNCHKLYHSRHIQGKVQLVCENS